MENSKIGWTGHTANFWMGCQKTSAGCKYCYMFRDRTAYGQDPTKIVRTSDGTFYQPLEWKTPARVFTCSWSDFFIEEADLWREEAWDVIRRTPHLTWQILTKRPERIQHCLPEDWGEGWPHVQLGVSIENEQRLYRAATLAGITCKTRFVSFEPLLDQIDLSQGLYADLIKKYFHWAIIGGESGNEEGPFKYRPCKMSWIEKIVQDLKGSRVEIFIKQMGTHLAKTHSYKDKHGTRKWEWPRHLQIQNFPK